jgi:predicted amidophosphoribosyltransferase
MKETLCIWQCGRRTRNHTHICDLCWTDRENIYLARKAREAAEKKPLSAARKAALEKLNEVKRPILARNGPARRFLSRLMVK